LNKDGPFCGGPPLQFAASASRNRICIIGILPTLQSLDSIARQGSQRRTPVTIVRPMAGYQCRALPM
jgi:hypothetical protein